MTTMPQLPGINDAPLPAWPGELVEAGRYRLYTRTTKTMTGNDGPQPAPAVYVHGLGGSSTNWTDLSALLADRFDGLALDLPGHGRSPASPNGRYPLAAHAAAVEALLEATARGPAHLVGNSLGGAVSTLVAARRPDLVRSLTLISPAFPQLDPRRAGDLRLAAVMVPGLGRLAARRLRRLPVDVRTRAVLEMCYADPTRLHPDRVAAEVEESRRRAADPLAELAFIGSARGLVGAYLAAGRKSLWAAAARVRAPVQIVWGAHDRLVPVALAARVQAAFRLAAGGARLEIFDDAGHVAMMEAPDKTAAVMRSFLVSLRY